MVYQIFSDGIDRKQSLDAEQARRRRGPAEQQPGGGAPPAGRSGLADPRSSAFYANLLIILIKLLLFAYDALTLPVYFALQRPDRRAQAARKPRALQVDANTWVRASGQQQQQQQQEDCARKVARHNKWRFMGATVSEIFANAVRAHNSNACLGYRALVTCPVIALDERGQHVFRDQSFRSDFTWYTYGQIGRRVQDLASGLYHKRAVLPSGRAMFLASSCLEWFCMAHACFQLAVQLVLWPELNQNDLATLHAIILQAQVELLLVSCDQLALLCRYLEFAQQANSISNGGSQLKKIVIIDWQFAVDFNEPLFAQLGHTLRLCERRAAAGGGEAAAAKLGVLSIGQVEEAGIENPIELRCSRALSSENLSLFAESASSGISSGSSSFKPSSNGDAPEPTRASEVFKAPAPHADRKASEAPAPRPSRWSVGAEPIDTTTCASAPLIRRRRAAQKRPGGGGNNHSGSFIYGNNKQLETSLLNAHRNLSSAPVAISGASNKPAPQTLATGRPGEPARPEHLALIVYTHGALGQLKALMLTHGQLARSNQQLFLDGLVGPGHAHCAVLPLDSLIELLTELCVLANGGSIAYSNNLQTLFRGGRELFERDQSDLETAHPTHLLVRPYILEQLRASLQDYLQLQLNPLASFVFKNVLYEYKKHWARRYYSTPIVDQLFCARLKRFFGARMRHILCNGPTDCSETKDFFAFMVNLPVVELYGPDEASASMISSLGCPQEQRQGGGGGAVTQAARSHRWLELDGGGGAEEERDFCDMQLMPARFNTNTYRENLCKNILITSSIFAPTSNTRVRLEDWEEFRLSDAPFPRGRLVIGGDAVCAGYLNSNEPDSEPEQQQRQGEQCEQGVKAAPSQRPAFFRDSNGISWFRTGDLARAFPNGSFEIISAISNIIKMVDGQLVSLSQIEHILRNSQFVDNVCALCGGEGTFVINLVVPNLRRIARKSPNEANLKMAIGMEPEPDELSDVDFRREVCNDRLLCEFVTDHLSKLLAQSGLASITNRFLLVPEIWTPQSELVTLAYEPKRQAVQKFYANDIQSLVRMQARTNSRRLSDNRRARQA